MRVSPTSLPVAQTEVTCHNNLPDSSAWAVTDGHCPLSQIYTYWKSRLCALTTEGWVVQGSEEKKKLCLCPKTHKGTCLLDPHNPRHTLPRDHSHTSPPQSFPLFCFLSSLWASLSNCIHVFLLSISEQSKARAPALPPIKEESHQHLLHH